MMALFVVAGCVPNPPGVDEVLCGWQRSEWWEASANECVRVVGSSRLRPAPDACSAPSAATCEILRPGESTWLYTDSTDDHDATVTSGDCETLRCE